MTVMSRRSPNGQAIHRCTGARGQRGPAGRRGRPSALARCGRLAAAACLAVALVSAGCGVQRSAGTTRVDAGADWVLLPIVNYAQTPRAGQRAEAIVATLLRSRGIRPASYPRSGDDGDDDGLPVLNDERRLERARRWAQAQDFDYALTGSVAEWRYKSGLGGEPAVGLTLRVIELPSGDTVWSASGARTGWGRESLAGTAQTVADELLERLPIEGR